MCIRDSCIKLKKLDYQKQNVILYNSCDYNCRLTNWTIKDEGNKKFTFSDFVLEKNKKVEIRVGKGVNNKEILFWRGQDYVWTQTGDTLFLRDGSGKLVLWKTY